MNLFAWPYHARDTFGLACEQDTSAMAVMSGLGQCLVALECVGRCQRVTFLRKRVRTRYGAPVVMAALLA